MTRLKLLDVIALREDLPLQGLVAGQVGTIVEDLGHGIFEVEFSDDEGRPYALASLPEQALMALHYEPVAAG